MLPEGESLVHEYSIVIASPLGRRRLFRHPRGRSNLSNLPGKQTAKRDKTVPQAWILERCNCESDSGCFVAWRVVLRTTPQASRSDKKG